MAAPVVEGRDFRVGMGQGLYLGCSVGLSVRLGRVEWWLTDSVVLESPVLFIHLSGDMMVSREAPRPSRNTQRGPNERSIAHHVLSYI